MQSRLRIEYGMQLDRESVRIILVNLDPMGVLLRKRRRLKRRQYINKGPNFVFHIDGCDKLKRYGLCVHGCIDGFSRKIMWLRAAYSNNDPYIVCKFYAQCARENNGVPCVIRSDRGTENVNIELMQTILRYEHDDIRGVLGTSFMYGRSTSNERIECWWSKFPMLGMQTWINHFTDLVQFGILDVSQTLDIECIPFCYLDLLQRELDLIARQWNCHYIRASKRCVAPFGKPDIMFYLPTLYGTHSYLKDLNPELHAHLETILTRQPDRIHNLYTEIFETVLQEKVISQPNTLDEASDMCAVLLDKIYEELLEDG